MIRGESTSRKDLPLWTAVEAVVRWSAVGAACLTPPKMNLAGPAASQDPVRAQALFKQGCDAGDERACARVKKLSSAGTLGASGIVGRRPVDSTFPPHGAEVLL